jgi:hypothetical protein
MAAIFSKIIFIQVTITACRVTIQSIAELEW